MIFDTHCHLNDQQLYERIDEIIADSEARNVCRFLVVGWDYESSKLAVEIAHKYKGCYAAVGIHPENIDGVSEETLYKTLDLSNDKKVVAIGEIGLDYHWRQDNKEAQKEFFIKQIKYANEHHLPVSIHNRDAFHDCLEILENNKPLFSGVMHCYSGSLESLEKVLHLGLYIGLGGPLTFTNAKTPKEVAENIPLESLVVETDAPYLAPHPLRGTVNEPKNVVLVVDEIANIRKMSKKHLLDVLYQNSNRLFNIKDE